MDEQQDKYPELRSYRTWCAAAFFVWLLVYFRLPGQYPTAVAVINTTLFVLLLPAFLDILAMVSLANRNYELMNLLITPSVAIGELMHLIPGNPFALGLPYSLELQALALLHLEDGRKAERVLRRLIGLNDQMPDMHPLRMATATTLLGSSLAQQGKFAESEIVRKQAIAVLETQLDSEPTRVAASLCDLCTVLAKQGQIKQSLAAGERALKIMESIRSPDQHELVMLGMALNNLAVAYDYAGDAVKAQSLYQKSLDIKLELFGNKSREAVIGYNNLGFALLLQSQYDKAIEPLENAKKLAIALGLQNGRIWMDVLNNCGEAHRGKGLLAEAETELLEALRLREKAKNENLHESYYYLGKLYTDKQDFTKAQSYFDKALHLREKRFGNNHPKTVQTLEDYAKLLRLMDRESVAEQMEERINLIRSQIDKY